MEMILEQMGAKSWKAYFADDPSTCGVGGSRQEAAGSLYINKVGNLILAEPARFGFTLTELPLAAE